MRLIDADKIVYYESIDADTLAGTGKFYAPRELIDAMPTIEDRKTGKWIKARYVLTSDPVQYVWNCSECGKSVSGRSAAVLTDYCPNCGSYNGGLSYESIY